MATGVVAVTCLFASGSAALAQTPGSDRPYRALFGRGSQGGGHSLDASATLMGAYDDNILAEGGLVSPGADAVSGQYAMLQTVGTYGWATQRVQLGMTGASAFQYFAELGQIQSGSHSLGVGVSTTLPQRTGLALNQAIAYSPSYLSGLFASLAESRLGDAPPASPNFDVNDAASTSYVSTATITRGVGRRGSAKGVADYTFTDFRGQSIARQDGASYGVRAEFSRNVGRHSSVSTGYRYRTGDFSLLGNVEAARTTEHGLDLGLEHTRILSATRSAHYSFGIGASHTGAPPLQMLPARSESGVSTSQLYRLTGNAGLAYQFSRTGEVRASYRRGVEYILELSEPVFSDAVSASISGSPARRLHFMASAGYSTGASALQATSKFDTYTANVRSNVAITRMVSLYLEYLYYVYDFGAAPLLAPSLPRQLERNGVRAGITLSTLLLRR
jgi:hypothetical protein